VTTIIYINAMMQTKRQFGIALSGKWLWIHAKVDNSTRSTNN